MLPFTRGYNAATTEKEIKTTVGKQNMWLCELPECTLETMYVCSLTPKKDLWQNTVTVIKDCYFIVCPWAFGGSQVV